MEAIYKIVFHQDQVSLEFNFSLSNTFYPLDTVSNILLVRETVVFSKNSLTFDFLSHLKTHQQQYQLKLQQQEQESIIDQ